MNSTVLISDRMRTALAALASAALLALALAGPLMARKTPPDVRHPSANIMPIHRATAH